MRRKGMPTTTAPRRFITKAFLFLLHFSEISKGNITFRYNAPRDLSKGHVIGVGLIRLQIDNVSLTNL